jgi:hypothetical protein
MRYEPNAEGEGASLRGAAARYDRWGTRRGNPYAADPAWDEPPPPARPAASAWTGGAGGGWSGSVNRWDDAADAGYGADGGYAAGGPGAVEGLDDEPPGAWNQGWDDAADGVDVYPVHLWGGPWLPPRTWMRWRRRHWFPRFARMVRTARPAGTLRSRSGARYPVFRGRMGSRSFRMVARPRGGMGGRMRYEVMAMEEETGGGDELLAMQREAGGEGELLALPGAGAATSAGYTPLSSAGGGYRLRLPHAALHTVLGRLGPEQLRTLTGGTLPADPAAAVARGVGRVARRARRLGRFRGAPGGPRLDVFGTRGFRLLVRPTGEMEGEIVAVTPVAGEGEGEMEGEIRSITASLTWYGPFRFAASAKDVLSPINRGAKVPNLSGGGIYLFEKLGSKGWEPIYVGKADSFAKRLGTRREYLRQLGVTLNRYRVYLGVSPTGGANLHALEHAVVRSVLRGVHKATAAASTDPDVARKIPFEPLRNLTPRLAFQVGAGGLSVTHAPAAGHAIPAYLRSGTGTKGQWYELPE